MTREQLIETLKQAGPIAPSEIASAFKPGSVLFRLMAHLGSNVGSNIGSMLHMNLITEEGRLEAIKQQGLLQGRMSLLEEIFDLILEGMENESGSTSE